MLTKSLFVFSVVAITLLSRVWGQCTIEIKSQYFASFETCQKMCHNREKMCEFMHYVTKQSKCYIYEKEGAAIITKLADHTLTASSNFFQYSARMGRLHSSQGWCPNTNTFGEYIQVDMQRTMMITGVATQGEIYHLRNDWTTEYKIAYSNDASLWADYTEEGITKVFSGNVDMNTVVKHNLPEVFNARYVRVYPLAYAYWQCLRWEVYGCE